MSVACLLRFAFIDEDEEPNIIEEIYGTHQREANYLQLQAEEEELC